MIPTLIDGYHFEESYQKKNSGHDSEFSMEPDEFQEMVQSVRMAEQAISCVTSELTDKENNSRIFRKSIFVVENIKAGEVLTPKNTRVIRSGYGMEPKYIDQVIVKTTKRNINKGSPLHWEDPI